MPRLENWSVFVDNADGYKPPELLKRYLNGTVFDHPFHSDGKSIDTSSIQVAEGKVVVTRSGTRYELGSPSPDYLRWLQEKGLSFDPENPIKRR